MRPARLAPALGLVAGLFAAAALGCASRLTAAEPEYVPMFNGKDLTGWVNVNCAPDTFFVKDGEIITTGKPTGFLRTTKQYENFVLEMEWMHENKEKMGNSGLFVWGDPIPAVGTGYTRGIEVQVLVNYEADWATSHGDIFSIWGAHCTPDRPHPKGAERCLPSERRCKGGGEWNHYKVIANDGAIKLHVNGKEVSGVSKCTPRKGYLALESEGAVCHFKNLKIKELPSTNPKPEDVANLDQGHKSLFDGLTLTGWKTDEGAWKPSDGILRPAGKADLTSEAKFGDYELLFDWKLPAKSNGEVALVVGKDGAKPLVLAGKAGGWHRGTVRVEKRKLTTEVDRGSEAAQDAPAEPGPIAFKPAEGLELRNLFLRELK